MQIGYEPSVGHYSIDGAMYKIRENPPMILVSTSSNTTLQHHQSNSNKNIYIFRTLGFTKLLLVSVFNVYVSPNFKMSS